LKIYASSDHAGFTLRGKLVGHLRRKGLDVDDRGPASAAQPLDYPDEAGKIGRLVRGDPGSLGLLVCGSGIGVCMAANKVRGVRAAHAWNVDSARLSRSHNDANVLCLGERLITDTEAFAIVDAWLDTPFDGGERHVRRVTKIQALESEE
jgi:ribose 5-phosphate isomerase B